MLTIVRDWLETREASAFRASLARRALYAQLPRLRWSAYSTFSQAPDGSLRAPPPPPRAAPTAAPRRETGREKRGTELDSDPSSQRVFF